MRRLVAMIAPVGGIAAGGRLDGKSGQREEEPRQQEPANRFV